MIITIYLLTSIMPSYANPKAEDNFRSINITNSGPFFNLSFPLLQSPSSNEKPKGLFMEKNSIYNKEKDEVEIKIDVFTEGKVTVTKKKIPADIVLVLDQSGSMSRSFGSSSMSKQAALKTAVEKFLLKVKEHNKDIDDNNKKDKVAIVEFSNSAYRHTDLTYDYDASIGSIRSLTNRPRGATRIDEGIIEAEDILYNSQMGRKKVVVMFTDGYPTKRDGFDLYIANESIQIAKDLKDRDTTIYTVGIFKGANPNILYGEDSLDSLNSGQVNSIFGKTKNITRTFDSEVLIPIENIDKEFMKEYYLSYPANYRHISVGFSRYNANSIDVYAANRFLNYISSNFADSTSLGIKQNGKDFKINSVDYYQRYIGFYPHNYRVKITTAKGNQITQNFNRSTNDNYYLSADNEEDLNTIFTQIAENTASPNIEINQTAIINDIIAPQFTLASGDLTSIKIQTADCTGYDDVKKEYTFSKNLVDLNGITPTIDGRKVSITGFDFSKNFVTKIPKIEGSDDRGRKLVITVKLKRNPDFFGGNKIETNGEGSGINYIVKNEYDEDEEKFVPFNIPSLNMDIKLKEIELKEEKIYIYNPFELEKAVNFNSGDSKNKVLFKPDGINNKYVDIDYIIYEIDGKAITPLIYNIPSGKKVNEGSWKNGKKHIGIDAALYSLKVKLTPSIEMENGVEAVEKLLSGSLKVYKPLIEKQNSKIYKGEETDLNANVKFNHKWKNAEEVIDVKKISNEISGNEPSISFSFDGFTNTVIKPLKTSDYSFKVYQSNNKNEKDELLPLNLKDYFATDLSPLEKNNFKIDVVSAVIEIIKEVENYREGDIFKFKLISGEKVLNFFIKGSGSIKIKDLAIGDYRIVEDSSWSWRYENITDIADVSIQAKNEDMIKTINFKSKFNNDKWLDFNNLSNNLFEGLAKE